MKSMIRLIPVGCLLLACSVLPALAQGPDGGQGSQPWLQFEKQLGLQTTYSVDMVIQAMGMNMDSHIARDGGKTRTEMTMPMMNLKMVSLEIPEGGKTISYGLFPEKKKYILNEEADEARAAAPAMPQIEDLGTEVYEGVTCSKKRVVSTENGMKSEMIMLLSPKQKNMPVKMTMTASVPAGPGRPAMPMQSAVLFKNYDFSTPDAKLFTIPSDYAKAASMMEIMMDGGGFGAMLQQMQQQMPAGK